MSNAVAKIEPKEESRELAIGQPDRLRELALSKGADMATLERLMDLKDRHEATEARKAYVAAMAAFKAEPLAISKDKHVKFTTQKGVTEYDHATLGNVVRTVVGGLARHGLSHAWATKRLEGGRIEVSCRITHALGHSESIALDAAPDDSGGKNNIQALGSAITYLQRYTLLAITGLATDDMDDDGRGAGSGGSEEADQAQVIIGEWLQVIADCADMESLAARKEECKKAYGMSDLVPKVLKAKFASRAKELQP